MLLVEGHTLHIRASVGPEKNLLSQQLGLFDAAFCTGAEFTASGFWTCGIYDGWTFWVTAVSTRSSVLTGYTT